MNRMLGVGLALLLGAVLAGCATDPYGRPYDLGTRDTAYRPAYGGWGERYHYGQTPGYTGWYPWWSVDYFYLGHDPYRPGYGWYGRYDPFWYPRGYGWYSGASWGWPYWRPWPRYAQGGFVPYWRYPRWRDDYPGHAYRPPGNSQPPHRDRDRRPQPVGSHGGQLGDSGYRRGIEEGLRERDGMRRARGGRSDRPAPPRSVTVAPRGNGNRGMIVIGGSENKIGRSRPEPRRRSGVDDAAPRVPDAAGGRPGVLIRGPANASDARPQAGAAVPVPRQVERPRRVGRARQAERPRRIENPRRVERRTPRADTPSSQRRAPRPSYDEDSGRRRPARFRERD